MVMAQPIFQIGQKQTCLQNLTTVLSAIGIIRDLVRHGHVPSRPMFVAITMFTEEILFQATWYHTFL